MSRRTAPCVRAVLALITVLGLAGCGGSDGEAQAREPAAVDAAQEAIEAATGCPLTARQIAGTFGVEATGGDLQAAPSTLACSFLFNLDGRSMVLSGVPLDKSPLPRLERINRKAGGTSKALTTFGPNAFSYAKTDPSSEIGLAYTATATFPAGSRTKNWVYKFAIVLPTQDPRYDVQALLTTLQALLESLPADHPLAPAARG